MRMRTKGIVVAALFAGAVWAVARPAGAQRVQASGRASVPSADTDALERYLFTPELIMRHYREIDLEPAQRETITRAMEQLQVGLVDLQWRLMESTQQLEEALSGPSIEEERAVALVDQVLAMEREVKTRHLTALIRIKNALTAEQQEELTRLKGPQFFRSNFQDIQRGSLPVEVIPGVRVRPDTTVSGDSIGGVRGRVIRVVPSASGRVTGRVVDEASGRPLAGAQVMLTGTQTGVLTQADGRFLLIAVPVGPQTIRVQLIGYGPVERTVTVAEDATARMDFELSTGAVAVEGVQVRTLGVMRR